MSKFYQLPPSFADWIQSLPFVTQSAHVGWGGLIVAVGAHVFRDTPESWGIYGPVASGLLCLALWTLPKELIFDRFAWGEGHGSPDYWDLLFYWIGGMGTVGILVGL